MSFDRYAYYENAVQSPESDIDFINSEFRKLFKRRPLSLREDFCGTGKLICEWVKQSSKHIGKGVDLDPTPIRYGLMNHWRALDPKAQKRVQYIQQNVLDSNWLRSDVICAFNYSFFVFKSRRLLIEYFRQVRASLKNPGFFVLDLFGGTESMIENEESRNLGKFTYYWECEHFNPITHECFFSIHFKDRGSSKKRRRVFTYDWRLWTFPEIREALLEAGFSDVHCYWEGDGPDGTGDGIFRRTLRAENCQSWISYVIAVP